MSRAGRPTRLGQKVGEDKDGKPIRLEDRILAALQRGEYVETACAYAGVAKSTVYDWLKIGARAPSIAEREGRRLTAQESRCVEFSYAVEQAIAAADVEDITRIRAAGSQPARKSVTVTRQVPVADGTVEGGVRYETMVETREEELPPDWRALAWHRERRNPKHWGRREYVEHTGPEGGGIPLEVRIESLVDGLRKIQDTPEAEADPAVEPSP